MEHSKYYSLWQKRPSGEVCNLGALFISAKINKQINHVIFQYNPSLISQQDFYPLDPINAPLSSEKITYPSSGRDLPGFIDDCLPDDWGRKIIAHRLQKRFVDTLTILDNIFEGASIGAIKITPAEMGKPDWYEGIQFEQAKQIAGKVWDGDLSQLTHNEAELSILVNNGSRVGGARPKLLAYDKTNDKHRGWVVKFNREKDDFNHAKLEWACLEVFRRSGFRTAETQLDTVGNREVLKVARFDLSPQGGRFHTITMNSLLKDPNNQDDPLYACYEDLAEILRKYSTNPKEDLEQLFGQMLINQALHNTDDHLRNFSLIQYPDGWRLSPVYDVVPDATLSSEHQLAVLGSTYLPSLQSAEAIKAGQALGLTQPNASKIIEKIKNTISSWDDILLEANLSKSERVFARKVVTKNMMAKKNDG